MLKSQLLSIKLTIHCNFWKSGPLFFRISNCSQWQQQFDLCYNARDSRTRKMTALIVWQWCNRNVVIFLLRSLLSFFCCPQSTSKFCITQSHVIEIHYNFWMLLARMVSPFPLLHEEQYSILNSIIIQIYCLLDFVVLLYFL